MPLKEIENLAKQIKNSKDPEYIENGLRKIVEQYEIINFECSYSMPFFRARLVEKGEPYSHVSEISYPPKDFAKVGRVNEEGQPFLYLSFNASTALSEIKAMEGDVIQLSQFVPISRSPRVLMIGEYSRISRGNNSFFPDIVPYVSQVLKSLQEKSPAHVNCFLYPDLFFDEILKMPDASVSNYIHSRILARLLLDEPHNLEGIMYHSVANAGGFNVALPADKADSLLRFDHTILVRIKNVFSYGIYDYEAVQMSRGKTESGRIVW